MRKTVRVPGLVVPIVPHAQVVPRTPVILLHRHPLQIPCAPERVGAVVIIILRPPHVGPVALQRDILQLVCVDPACVVAVEIARRRTCLKEQRTDQIVGAVNCRVRVVRHIRETVQLALLGRRPGGAEIAKLDLLSRLIRQHQQMVHRIVSQRRLIGGKPRIVLVTGVGHVIKPQRVVDDPNHHHGRLVGITTLDIKIGHLRHLLHKPTAPVEPLVGRAHPVAVAARMSPRQTKTPRRQILRHQPNLSAGIAHRLPAIAARTGMLDTISRCSRPAFAGRTRTIVGIGNRARSARHRAAAQNVLATVR